MMTTLMDIVNTIEDALAVTALVAVAVILVTASVSKADPYGPTPWPVKAAVGACMLLLVAWVVVAIAARGV